MKYKIYRVYNSKNKYQQSYSQKLNGSIDWAMSCADSVNGFVNEDVLNTSGETESSKKIYKNSDSKAKKR
jgi:hypothetical protein